MLGDDLDAWLEESCADEADIRNNALIAGLIERRMPKGERRTPDHLLDRPDLRRVRSHEPDHLLLQAARQDGCEGLLDIRRLGEALKRIRGHIVHAKLDQNFAVCRAGHARMGKEPVFSGDAAAAILREAEARSGPPTQ